MMEYEELLETEVFKHGKTEGHLRTLVTILTDMLLELNSLEIYYQKPSTKAIDPPQIRSLRRKIELAKSLIVNSR
jgi:hypothetical protein